MTKKIIIKVCENEKKVVPLHRKNRGTFLYDKHRGVEQLVARQAHNLEVACSNPASATVLGNRYFACYPIIIMTIKP